MRQMRRQVPYAPPDALALRTERLGPLPLVNHFLERLGLEAQLERFVPTHDRRVRLPYAKGLGLLLRSLLVEREPMYRAYETVSRFVSKDTIARLVDADERALKDPAPTIVVSTTRG